MENKLLLSVEESAQTLGISRSLLYRLLNRGAFRSVKVGRKRKILASSVTEYITHLEQAEEASRASTINLAED